jgi:hypothetical protein
MIMEGFTRASLFELSSRTIHVTYFNDNILGCPVKGDDIESGEGLVVSRTGRNAAVHVTFESWGQRPHTLHLTDVRNNERRTETVTLVHTGRRTGIGFHWRNIRTGIEQALE